MKVVQKMLAAVLIAAVMGCWMGVATLADPVDETEQAPTQEYTSSLRTTIHSQEPEETLMKPGEQRRRLPGMMIMIIRNIIMLMSHQRCL